MARRRIGMYDHLNSDLVQLPISMDSLARIIATENYGLHRFLSAIVRIRRGVDEDFKRKHPHAPPDEHTLLTEAIAEALEKGGY